MSSPAVISLSIYRIADYALMVAARKQYIINSAKSLNRLLSALQDSAKEFHIDKDKTLDFIAEEYNLSKEDASVWFDSVKYSKMTKTCTVSGFGSAKH